MSGSTQKRLTEDMKTALRAGEKEKLTLLRMLINDLKNEQLSRTDDDLSEEQELAVLRRSAKMRREALEQARELGREEIASREERELGWIESYLPQVMDVEEVEARAAELIAELGIESRKETGRFMKEWMSRYRAVSDGKIVQQVLGKLLG
ncbi:MAG: GatB/YqeY domain-containing protein [Planctomycetota bacterium]